jgi:uncharacterized protein
MRTLVIFAVLLLMTGAQARTIGEKAVENHIRPVYARLADAMDGLSKATVAYCEAEKQKNRKPLDAAFRTAVLAWAGAEHIRFGPVTEQNRYERFAFWPDPKGVGLKQIAAALKEKDPGVTTPEGLAQKSVALQGLTAFEVLFWGADAEKAEEPQARAFRCTFAKAIAANLTGIGADLRQAWAASDGFAAQFTAPGEGKVYRDDKEVTLEIFKAFRTSLQQIRTYKLNRVLMGNPEEAQPRRAAYWRSGNAMGVIIANVAAAKAVYQQCGLYEIVHATGHGIDQSTLDQFHLIEETLEGLKAKQMADIAASQKSWAQLNSVVFGLINIQVTGGNAITEAAELPMSFNALDGD